MNRESKINDLAEVYLDDPDPDRAMMNVLKMINQWNRKNPDDIIEIYDVQSLAYRVTRRIILWIKL